MPSTSCASTARKLTVIAASRTFASLGVPLPVMRSGDRPRRAALEARRRSAHARAFPVAVAAVVRPDIPVADLDDPVGDAVEEVAVVADGDHGAVVGLEGRLERLDGRDVEMV